ncbi:MAG: peptidoglycan DD-metalloendopeptidase family protein [Acidobacteriota bacterium]
MHEGRAAVTILCLALLAAAPAALAQDADRTTAEGLSRRATGRVQALQQEADQLASREKSLLGDLRALELDRQINLERVRALDSEAREVARERAATTERLEALQREELAARPQLEARLVEMYKLGQGRYVRLLLATSDVRRIGAASRTVAVLAKLDRDRLAVHQQMVDALMAGRGQLEERSRRLEALRREAGRASADAARAVQARNDMIRDIDRQRDLNAQLAGELQAAQQNLQSALRTLSAGASPATLAAATLPLKPFKGALEWPAAGTVRRPFSPSAARGATTNGIEIAAPEGAPVGAVHEGTVVFADAFSGFGNLVIIDHGNQTFSLYGQLLEVQVAKGGRVEASQVVGTVGAGPLGAAGLYFELRIDGHPVDPLQWLKKRT